MELTALDWRGWTTAGVLVGLIGMLVTTKLPSDVLFVAAVTVLLLLGVITPAEAFGGLANEGVLTVAVLYVVVAGIRETGGIQWIVHNLLGKPSSLSRAQTRLTLPVAGLSAFLNNTPVVALMIPAVTEWARRFSLPESKLFIPLSYAAILGGTCTLIGTSTNLVVNGLLIEEVGAGMHMFAITPIGIPVAVAGMLFMFLGARWLLPSRQSVAEQLEDVREYTIEMLVDPDGPLVGQTIEQASLRHLPGCFVVEINRGEQVLPAVSPSEVLQANDRLVLVGAVDSIVDLRKIRGLTPATDQVFKLDDPRNRRVLVEAVLSNTSPLVGRSIRAGQFRSRYGAVVIAVARRGERMKGKVGDIVLEPGDTLLLEAGGSFLRSARHSNDFLLTRRIEGSEVPRHERAGVAAAILVGMVALAGFGFMPMLNAAMLAAGMMLATRCLSTETARSAVDWSVLVVIAAAFGLGAAMDETGLAELIGFELIGLAGQSTSANLALTYVATMLLSAVMTNNAAAVLMFPIAMSTAGQIGVEPVGMAMLLMFAASASFATPISYQTNLMVMGAGGYRFGDYLRAGIPVTLVTGVVAVAMIIFWVG